jgi:hypothetical protein
LFTVSRGSAETIREAVEPARYRLPLPASSRVSSVLGFAGLSFGARGVAHSLGQPLRVYILRRFAECILLSFVSSPAASQLLDTFLYAGRSIGEPFLLCGSLARQISAIA